MPPITKDFLKIKNKKDKNLIYREISLPDGGVFRGHCTLNPISGFGNVIWPDMSIYDGEIKKNLPHGRGTKQWKTDESKVNEYKLYTGTWV